MTDHTLSGTRIFLFIIELICPPSVAGSSHTGFENVHLSLFWIADAFRLKRRGQQPPHDSHK